MNRVVIDTPVCSPIDAPMSCSKTVCLHKNRIRAMRATIAVIVALTMTGCSWVFMDKFPNPEPPLDKPVRCTTSRSSVHLDNMIATPAMLLAMIGLLVRINADSSDDKETGNGLLLGGGIVGGVFGWSSATGMKRSAKCRERRKRQRRLREQRQSHVASTNSD